MPGSGTYVCHSLVRSASPLLGVGLGVAAGLGFLRRLLYLVKEALAEPYPDLRRLPSGFSPQVRRFVEAVERSERAVRLSYFMEQVLEVASVEEAQAWLRERAVREVMEA